MGLGSVGSQFGKYLEILPLMQLASAPPNNMPSLIPRTITGEYYEGICSRLFPEEEGYRYGIAHGRNATTMNARTGGWDYTNTTRLMWSNG